MWYMLKELSKKLDDNTKKTDAGNQRINDLAIELAGDTSATEIRHINVRLDEYRDRLTVLESHINDRRKP